MSVSQTTPRARANASARSQAAPTQASGIAPDGCGPASLTPTQASGLAPDGCGPASLTPAFALMGPKVHVSAHGVRAQFEPTIRPGGLQDQDRFRQGATWLQDNLQADDIAFLSYTFNPFAPGSRIVIPEHVDTRSTLTAMGAPTVEALVSGPTCASIDLPDDPIAAQSAAPPAAPTPAQSAAPIPVQSPAPTATTPAAQAISQAATTPDQATAHPDFPAWQASITQATQAIRAGHLDKVVLARSSVLPTNGATIPALLAGLQAAFPTCLIYRFDDFIGATPEILLEVTGRHVTSLVLAGSAPNTPAGRDALLSSPKDTAEHAIAATSVLQRLRPYCTEAAITTSRTMLRLPHVVHIASVVTGTLREDVHIVEALGELHPTAAVCGTPRDDAMGTILELEAQDRGRFAGPVGVIAGNGDALIGLALRCGQVSPDGEQVTLFAGCGIMEASDPVVEFVESELKMEAMRSTLLAIT